MEYISKRGYSHSISRLSVEPAAFGTWRKITASEAQSAWVMAGLLLGGGLSGGVSRPTLRGVIILFARFVLTLRYQYNLLRLFSVSPAFLIRPDNGRTRLHALYV